MTFQITRGKVQKKECLAITGVGGIGKSTFGAEAPNPIFIPVEEGSNALDVARFPKPKSFEEVMSMLAELPKKEFGALVFDSLDHFEPLIWEHAVKIHSKEKGFENVKTIEGFGYGKGYTFAEKYWRDFLKEIARIRESMHVILIAHCKVKTINDPLQPLPYDKFVIKLQERAKAVVYETVDTVLFANYEVYLKEGPGEKGKAFGDGKRFLYTREMPAHEAKNRDGLPYQIPMEKGQAWSAYMASKATADPTDPKILADEIKLKAERLTDMAVKGKLLVAVEKANGNAETLSKILKQLNTMLGEK